MATVKWTQAQIQSTKAADNTPNLFGTAAPSRADKMKASRKLTNEFQKWVIDYLNNTGKFLVWRNNNIPSTRLAKEKKWLMGKTESGQLVKVEVEIPVVHFKANQTTVSTFDVIGFRIKDGMHLEIEVKYGKDTMDKDQKQHLANLQKSGCISFATSDQETFKKQIDPFILEDIPW